MWRELYCFYQDRQNPSCTTSSNLKCIIMRKSKIWKAVVQYTHHRRHLRELTKQHLKKKTFDRIKNQVKAWKNFVEKRQFVQSLQAQLIQKQIKTTKIRYFKLLVRQYEVELCLKTYLRKKYLEKGMSALKRKLAYKALRIQVGVIANFHYESNLTRRSLGALQKVT